MARENGGVVAFRSFYKNFSAMVLFLLLNLAVIHPSDGQDHTNFTQFYLNPYVLNSSYAGVDGQPAVSLIYRKQWMTIDGAPTITNVTLQAPLNKNLGAGLNITSDAKGFFNNTGMLFSMAYHVPIEDKTFLRFGLSAGGSWNTVDMKKLEAVNDPALVGILDNHASLAGNAGASFHHKTFNFGIALPAIFSPAYISEDALSIKEIKPFQALILHASNRFYFNDDKNIFEPYGVYRLNTGLPAQFELAGIFHLNHILWAGASYKEDFGVSALGGVKLKHMLAIGASYSIQQRGYDELNSPSFEVGLNYLFGPRKRGVPVYSFVNSVKVKEKKQSAAAQQALVARQKKAEAEKQRRAEAAAKLKQQQEEKRRNFAASEVERKEEQARAGREAQQRKEQAALAKLQEAEAARQKKADADAGAKRLAEQNRLEQERSKREHEERARQEQEEAARTNTLEKARIDAEAQQAEMLAQEESARLEAEARRREQDEQERLRQEAARQKQRSESVAANTPPPVSVEEVPEGDPQHEQLEALQTIPANPLREIEDTSRLVTNVRHETVKRGNHPEELEPSEYVIAGAFKSSANAKHFADGLRNLEFNARYGYQTEKELWFVYILKTADPKRAGTEQARVSKMFLLRDAWLLTVHP